MINSNEIRAELNRKGLKIKDLAEQTGIPEARLYNGLSRRKLSNADIDKIQKFMKFSEPWNIFFTD